MARRVGAVRGRDRLLERAIALHDLWRPRARERVQPSDRVLQQGHVFPLGGESSALHDHCNIAWLERE